MRSDPFGVYANQPRDETLRPTASAAGAGGGNNGGLSWLIVGILLGVVLLIGYQRYVQPDGGDGRGDRDRQDQRDDQREDKKQDDRKDDKQQAIDLKQHALVVVRDKKSINDDVDYTITMQDDDFWQWANTTLADVEILEDEDDLAVKLLGTITDKPPVVALINVQSRKVAWSMPLPKGGTDLIRSKLK